MLYKLFGYGYDDFYGSLRDIGQSRPTPKMVNSKKSWKKRGKTRRK